MSKQGSSVSLEYAISVLTYLETFTGKRLNDQEAKLWTERIQRYPKWKLLQVDGYAGGLNNGVFKYLDELKPPPEDPYSELGYDKERKQLPDLSDRATLEKKCGTELLHGLSTILLNGNLPDKKKAISELHAVLRERYPMFKNSLTL